MYPAVAPAARILQWQSPSFDYKSQLPWNLCLFNQMILETPRLILRPFQEEDVEPFRRTHGEPDFTRFSLGPYTYEQTQGVLQKFLSWNQAGLPSQFAVIFAQITT